MIPRVRVMVSRSIEKCNITMLFFLQARQTRSVHRGVLLQGLDPSDDRSKLIKDFYEKKNQL